MLLDEKRKNKYAFVPTTERFRRLAFGIFDDDTAHFHARYNRHSTNPAIAYALKLLTNGDWKFNRREFAQLHAEAAEKILKGEMSSEQKEEKKYEPLPDITFKSYQEFKTYIAKRYGRAIADKYCIYDGWTPEQCMAEIKKILGGDGAFKHLWKGLTEKSEDVKCDEVWWEEQKDSDFIKGVGDKINRKQQWRN